MNHGLNIGFLLAANKIDVTFQDDLGKKITGTGTAFFVKNSKGKICLITNRHVIDIDYKKTTSKYKNFKLEEVIIHNKGINQKTGLPTLDNSFIVPLEDSFIFPEKEENDVACLKDIKITVIGGNSPRLNYWIPYKFIADSSKINNKLSICDFVAFPGFPDWYDKLNNLPILRTGTIASIPIVNYSFSGSDDGDCIAYEAFSFGGSSGSPIFAIQKGIKFENGLSGGYYREVMLVGVNAGHLPIKGVIKSHSGISYFYKSSVILELIDK